MIKSAKLNYSIYRIIQSAGLAAVFAFLPSISLADGNEQDFSNDTQKPFNLKATVDDHLSGPHGKDKDIPQLSRQDVALAPSVAPIPPNNFDLGAEQALLLPSSPPMARQAPQTQQASPQVPQQAPQEQPASSMLEYGVDWSRWVSQLADHWYFNLMALEKQSGLQFHTARPCLIKFTCYPNGQIANFILKQSCGIPMYDQLEAQALLQCQPVAPFPHGTQRPTFTLVQGWESVPRQRGEQDFRPGSFGRGFPMEVVKQWMNPR